MKAIIAAVALALLAGCTSVPRQPTEFVSIADCRAIEGSDIRYDHKGHAYYKYICGGKGVWASPTVTR